MAATFSLFSPAELSFAQVPLVQPAGAALPGDEVPLRVDGRTPLEYRQIVLETDVSRAQGALGSAQVTVHDAAGAGGGAYTQVWAGVRGEVDTISSGQQGGRIIIGLECTPTAQPSLDSELPQHLASILATLFSPSSLPPAFLSQLVILPNARAWTLYLDVLVIASDGGNVIDSAVIAARAALASARIPQTRTIGLEEDTEAANAASGEGAGMTMDEGFSGLVKGGKGGSKAVDFELVDGGEQGVRLQGWQELPVSITLNLIDQTPHLDATVLEESAASSRLVASFLSSGNMCGVTQLGEGEIEYARMVPLLTEAGKYAQDLIKSLNAKLRDV
ncbi:hypothetical protein JCM8115_006632 [Rhodotorula mucilaginosa]|uniref:Ribosomal RNA-processing protein 42 n=1 Tax=Rhodotorula mucilaginosa TaxID=5537 RepID=A0A9P7B6X8_RHOMI|nr:hypothetical protein C6P46_002841 [Rhodotorula mucilaginosa]TKA52319.1 hypothetical protein B0A53_04787 [Rhodotorula sp. CCFEE 5036]